MARTDSSEDIACTLIDGGGGLAVSLRFASGSASFDTMAQVADLYRRLLVAVVRDPRQCLQQLAADVPQDLLGSPPARPASADSSADMAAPPAALFHGLEAGKAQSGAGRPQAIVFAALVVVAALWAILESYFSGAGL
jgi:hypothetical protein